MKNILIFRTDRVGDLLVTCPAILTIKNYFVDANITIITSNKNYDYAKKLNFFTNIIKFPSKGFLSKVKFIYKLNKTKFDYIFIFDGKERSLISSFFINSKNKVAISTKIKKYYKIYNTKLFEFNEKFRIYDVFQNILDYLDIDTKINNFHFLKNTSDNKFSDSIPLDNFIHIHLDEKWFQNLYIHSYTNIKPSYDSFIEFLTIIAKKNNVLITTGLIEFELLNDLKVNFFTKINEKIFVKKFNNNSIYFIYKPNLSDIESLMRKSTLLFVCHGSLTHLANHFNIKIYDIIERSKIDFYKSYTHYLKNYNLIFRNDFEILKKEIIEII